MRIIAGKLKGRKLNPKGLNIRPTTDFAKEALFSILTSRFDLNNITVLDLFAGTGNISFEFFSRGASKVYSIDSDPKCISFISEMSKKLGINDIHPLLYDAFKFLDRTTQKFDIIFADPPFHYTNLNLIHQYVFEKKLLNKNGWLIIEHSKDFSFAEYQNIFMHRKYGKVHFSFFINQDE